MVMEQRPCEWPRYTCGVVRVCRWIVVAELGEAGNGTHRLEQLVLTEHPDAEVQVKQRCPRHQRCRQASERIIEARRQVVQPQQRHLVDPVAQGEREAGNG